MHSRRTGDSEVAEELIALVLRPGEHVLELERLVEDAAENGVDGAALVAVERMAELEQRRASLGAVGTRLHDWHALLGSSRRR